MSGTAQGDPTEANWVGEQFTRADELLGGPLAGMPLPAATHTYVMPLASELVSASVGTLTFLSYRAGSASEVFSWLVSVASVASLQSWAGMLFTYIRCVRPSRSVTGQ